MLRSINPATGERVAEWPELDAEGIESCLDKASRQATRWRQSPIRERVAILSALADIFDRDTDRLARTATSEMGKTLKEARAEVAKCAAGFRYFADHGPAMLEPVRFGDGKGHALWQPLGPILAVMPWNFPYWQVVRFLAPTILAGNVGLLKHASNVQGVAKHIDDAVREAGGPEGLFQSMRIGSKAVAPIIADSRVAAVTLTGSEKAGAAVAEAAGRALKKVVLELGGSDPFIVMPSADLDQAVGQAVKARIQNAGQSCICAKRMIVHRDVFAAFERRFVEAMLAVRPGDPLDEGSDIGPLSSMDQRGIVRGQIDKAVSLGARLDGGEEVEGPGAYIGGGVLTGLDPHGPMKSEEIFGPVAMLFEARDCDQAIAIANATPYGLGASIWTGDDDEKNRLTRDLACGMVAVNAMLASTPEAPFGGIKASGHGRELGPWGLHEFMNLKTVFDSAA